MRGERRADRKSLTRLDSANCVRDKAAARSGVDAVSFLLSSDALHPIFLVLLSFSLSFLRTNPLCGFFKYTIYAWFLRGILMTLVQVILPDFDSFLTPKRNNIAY